MICLRKQKVSRFVIAKPGPDSRRLTIPRTLTDERMHLLSFLKVSNPSLPFRLLVLGAQGVFYNMFFLSYLISPKTCHRFVGKLEEEAVVTYTMCINEIESGRLPEWENKPAPRIAIDYWRMKEDAKLLDMIYAVRADEAGHRVSHLYLFRFYWTFIEFDRIYLSLVPEPHLC